MNSSDNKVSVESDATKATSASGSRGGRGRGRGGNTSRSNATGSNKPGAQHRNQVKTFTENCRNYSYDKITTSQIFLRLDFIRSHPFSVFRMGSDLFFNGWLWIYQLLRIGS